MRYEILGRRDETTYWRHPVTDLLDTTNPGARLRARLPAGDVVWEAGHYYLAKGPTQWTEAGWKLASCLAKPDDRRLLFIDDVHDIHDVHPDERALDVVAFHPDPEPTHIMTESRALEHAETALENLRRLSKRARARASGGMLRCSGFALRTKDGLPTCLFYDLGLTWWKRELGATAAVNVVPHFYEDEQRRLLRLVRKAMPDFTLEVILHDTEGRWRCLSEE